MARPPKARKTGRRRPTANDMSGIFEAMCEGKAFTKACLEAGIDPPSAKRLIDDNEELSRGYTWAREMRGDHYAEQVINIALGAATNKIPGSQARAAIAGLQWAASRMNRKEWGDKLDMELTGKGGAPLVPVLNLTIGKAADKPDA
jgi:hypothetical protein